MGTIKVIQLFNKSIFGKKYLILVIFSDELSEAGDLGNRDDEVGIQSNKFCSIL